MACEAFLRCLHVVCRTSGKRFRPATTRDHTLREIMPPVLAVGIGGGEFSQFFLFKQFERRAWDNP